MAKPTLYGALPGLLAGVVLLVLYSPTLAWLVREWMSGAENLLGPAVVVLGVFIVVLRLPVLRAAPGKPAAAGWLLLAPTLLLHLYALQSRAPLLSAFTLPMALHGACLITLGSQRTRPLLLPVWMLLLALPLTQGLASYVSFPMRLVPTALAQALLSPFMTVAREGINLHTPAMDVAVVPACAGLNYLSTLLLLAVLLAWLSQDRPAARIVLVLMVVPTLLVANALRIATVAVVGEQFGRKAALGFLHGFSGLLVLVLAVLGILGISWILHRVYPRPVGLSSAARPRAGSDLGMKG